MAFCLSSKTRKQRQLLLYGTVLLIAIAPVITSANEALNQFNELSNVIECVSNSRIAVNCEKGFRVTWMNLEPYFSTATSRSGNNGTKTFKGMFSKVLQMLQLTCKYRCLGQDLINFDTSSSVIVQVGKANGTNSVSMFFDKEPMKSYSELTKEIAKEAKSMTTTKYPRLFLPFAVTESYVDTVQGFPFLFTVDAQELLYVERKVKGDILTLLWRGVVNSWELFIMVLLLAALFGMVVWLAERNDNRDGFPYEFSTGAAVGFWFSCVTMTTVGYGDKAPRTVCGRIATLAWMLISLCLFPLLMANFTNLIQEGTVNSLYGIKVAVLKDGPEATCARKENADIKEYATFKDALSALKNKETAGALLEKNSAIFLKRDIENMGLRIARTFKCELRFGIVAEPQVDPNNNKTVVNSIRNLQVMNRQCLTEKCRKKMRGEAVNQALLGAQGASMSSSKSTIQLLVPLIVLGSIAGAFILFGCAYDLITRNRPRSEATNEENGKSKKKTHDHHLSNVFTNFARKADSHEMIAK